MQVDTPFPKLRVKPQGSVARQHRRIPVPPNRFTPLQREWLKIYSPLVEQLGLEVRMNVRNRLVELRVFLLPSPLGDNKEG